MKPPPPTSHDPLKKDEQVVAHRAAMIPMILGLLAIGAFAVYTVWDDVQPRRVRKVTTGQMQIDNNIGYGDDMESAHGRINVRMIDMLPTADTGNYLLIRTGDQLLLSEPANLPKPAGGKRVTGFARTDGHITEQFALWNITGSSAEKIQQSYADAAISMGFSRLKAKTDSQSGATNQVYVRSPQLPDEEYLTPPAEQVLVVRTRLTTDKIVKLLLWYRYPVSQDLP